MGWVSIPASAIQPTTSSQTTKETQSTSPNQWHGFSLFYPQPDRGRKGILKTCSDQMGNCLQYGIGVQLCIRRRLPELPATYECAHGTVTDRTGARLSARWKWNANME